MRAVSTPRHTCTWCERPARQRVEYKGKRVWCCEAHRRRISRNGTPNPVGLFAVSDDQIRQILRLVVGKRLSHRKAGFALDVAASTITRSLRRWRQRLAEQREDGLSIGDSAIYWGVPDEPVEKGLDRFDQREGPLVREDTDE